MFLIHFPWSKKYWCQQGFIKYFPRYITFVDQKGKIWTEKNTEKIRITWGH